ncbi:MAG: hypothetical protein K2K67_04125 [Treponemataceae bacterium]|nr:hypothetical protein [Treponemataceae bacterium]
MKRTLLRRGAIIAACAAVFVLGSCGETEFDGRQDTVYSLETPSVSAKAYPGVNVVSWKPVTGASSYNVTVYEEGAFKRNIMYENANSFTDTNLVNGKTYTYSVEAVSATNPGTLSVDRAVYATNSRGEASVKAIVPPAGTKSLELPAYEGGYDGTNKKTVSDSDNWVVKPGNITVAVADGTVSVNFPMKAYLTYTVTCYDNDLPHEINTVVGTSSTVSDPNANNALGQASFDITNAGSYQIAVVASAYNEYYADSDEVIYGELIKIEKLALNPETSNATAEYVLTDNKFVSGADKTARVAFTPAKLNGEYVPTSWYTVYRRVKGEYTNTKVAAVKASTDTTYYVDDTVPDVTKDYVYTIVVTDGKNYGESATATLDCKTKTTISKITVASTVSNKDVKWTIKTADTAASVTPTAKYLIVQDDRQDDVAVLAQEIIEKGTALATLTAQSGGTATNKTYEVTTTVTSVTGNTAKVYLLVQATKDGYETTNVIGTATVNK